MRNSRRGSRRLAVLLGFACTLGVFTHAEAAVPTVPTISVTPATLTPYDSGGCLTIAPCYAIKGHTDPGVKVTVTITDAFAKSVTISGYSEERDDPWAGKLAGDYKLNTNVTVLGTHDGTDSVLTFVAYAENADGKSANSAPFLVTKKSATTGDTTGPVINSETGTPDFACGTGYCDFDPCLLVGLGGLMPQPFRDGWVGGWDEFYYDDDESHAGCTGRMTLAGAAEDNTPDAAGKISEIKDVIVTVKDSSGAVVKTMSAIGIRRGSLGYWAASLVVSDYVVGESYDWTAVAYDALGNASAPKSGSFTRAPL